MFDISYSIMTSFRPSTSCKTHQTKLDWKEEFLKQLISFRSLNGQKNRPANTSTDSHLHITGKQGKTQPNLGSRHLSTLQNWGNKSGVTVEWQMPQCNIVTKKQRSQSYWPMNSRGPSTIPRCYSHTIFGDPSWFGIGNMLQRSFFLNEVKGQGQIDLKKYVPLNKLTHIWWSQLKKCRTLEKKLFCWLRSKVKVT